MPRVKCCGPPGFPLVLVQLSAWLSRSPADPALTLPPVSFNKLTQAQTWDSSSYSVPSEGDSDNGRCLVVSSSMFVYRTRDCTPQASVCPRRQDILICMLHTEEAPEAVSRQVLMTCCLAVNDVTVDLPWVCWLWGGFLSVLSSLPILLGVWMVCLLIYKDWNSCIWVISGCVWPPSKWFQRVFF